MKTLGLLVPVFPSFLANGMSAFPEDVGVSVEEFYVGQQKENGLDSYFEGAAVEQRSEEAMQEAAETYGAKPRSGLPVTAVLGIAILATILACTFIKIYRAQVTEEEIKQFEEERKQFVKEGHKKLHFYSSFFLIHDRQRERLQRERLQRERLQRERLQREYTRLKFLLDQIKFDSVFYLKDKDKDRFLFEQKKHEHLEKQLQFNTIFQKFETSFKQFYQDYYMD